MGRRWGSGLFFIAFPGACCAPPGFVLNRDAGDLGKRRRFGDTPERMGVMGLRCCSGYDAWPC